MYCNFLKIQFLLGKIDQNKLDGFVSAGRLTAGQAEEIKTAKTTQSA